jgi:hypothetical protein
MNQIMPPILLGKRQLFTQLLSQEIKKKEDLPEGSAPELAPKAELVGHVRLHRRVPAYRTTAATLGHAGRGHPEREERTVVLCFRERGEEEKIFYRS